MFLRQLQYLREVVRCKSFSKAATTCGVSQPALSRAIRQLEEELGIIIIDRKKKVLGITDEGARVLKWANDILRGVSELRNEASMTKQAIVGMVKIGVIPTSVNIVPFLLEAVQERCGDFVSEVCILPNVSIIEKLVCKEIDIGIMYYDQCPQANAFEVRSLYEEHQVLVTSDVFQIPEGSHISWEKASQIPLALLTSAMRCRQLVDIGFQTVNAEPIIRLETNSLELIHSQVVAGKFATILPISSIPLEILSSEKFQVRRLPGFSLGIVGVVRLAELKPQKFGAAVWDSLLKTNFRNKLDLLRAGPKMN